MSHFTSQIIKHNLGRLVVDIGISLTGLVNFVFTI